jgi:hypothetical protein
MSIKIDTAYDVYIRIFRGASLHTQGTRASGQRIPPEPLQELGILLPILLSHQITATVNPSGPLIPPEI